jgi:protein-arginine kinase activator protein McsA
MCGRVKLDIGLRKERESKLFCNKCGTASTGSETYWVDSSRFIHREDISEQLNQAVEQENYELAAVLRDVLI